MVVFLESPSPLLVPLLFVALALAGCTTADDAPADAAQDAPPVVSGVHITGVRHDGVTIHWTVDDEWDTVRSVVTVRASGGAAMELPEKTGRGEHSHVVDGLVPDTLYEYVVVATDPGGQTTQGRTLFFGTLPAPAEQVLPDEGDDVQFDTLTLVDVRVFHAGHDSAIIAYQVAGATGSVQSHVAYGLTDAYGQQVNASAGAGAKEVTLPDLDLLTTYHFRVTATDETGNVSSDDKIFTTAAEPDTTPPTISAVDVIGTTTDKATITWEVADESGVQSWIAYSKDSSFASTSNVQGGIGVHTVTLDGLDYDATYNFRIEARDGEANEAESTSATFTTTSVGPPAVANVTVSGVGTDGFTVSFNVTGPQDVTSKVEYGTNASYGSEAQASAGGGAKDVVLSGLDEGVEYNFRVTAEAASGIDMSGNIKQYTAALVQINITNVYPLPGGGYFEPEPLELQAGIPYLFRVTNNDEDPHKWYIEGQMPDVEPAAGIAAGGQYTFPDAYTFAAGDYTQQCSFHPAAPDMEGSATVT